MAKHKTNERDPRELHKHTWYLGEALALVRLVQEVIWPLKYHVTLGGSVLNNGYADKDLDLFILPFNNTATASVDDIKATLTLVLSYVSDIGLQATVAGYGVGNEVHATKEQWSYEGKRVDVFIVRKQEEPPASKPASDKRGKLSVAKVREIEQAQRERIADYIKSCREDDTDRPCVQVFDVLALQIREGKYDGA